MTATTPRELVWDCIAPGCWMLRGRVGHASVTRGPGTLWTWALVGWPGRPDRYGQSPTRDAAMMAAQEALR